MNFGYKKEWNSCTVYKKALSHTKTSNLQTRRHLARLQVVTVVPTARGREDRDVTLFCLDTWLVSICLEQPN